MGISVGVGPVRFYSSGVILIGCMTLIAGVSGAWFVISVMIDHWQTVLIIAAILSMFLVISIGFLALCTAAVKALERKSSNK